MTVVLVTHFYTDHLMARMRRRSPDVRFVRLAPDGSVPKGAENATILLRCFMSKPELSTALSQAPELRWIHTCTAGFDQLLVPEISERGLEVTRSAATVNITIAEWVMASLLSLSKQFPAALVAQDERRWIGPDGWPEPVEMFGATMGIIGAGAIGTEVAKRAAGFGMKVIATKRTVRSSIPWYDEILPPTELHRLLRESDFVVVACPLTPATRNMLSGEEFALMKPTAYLTNIARGAVVDESALVRALRTHQIAGAALDVFVEEPLPPDSPLWEVDNLIITPHASARSKVSALRSLEEFALNLELFLRGAPLNNKLGDVSLGY